MFTQNQKTRLIQIAKCKFETGKVFTHVSCCGHSSLWSEMSRMVEQSTPNFETEFDWEYIESFYKSDGIRQALSELIQQAFYYSPDMNEFYSENYSVEITIK